MDHPNIARVLDAGATPDGRPYFVMELVKGVPITQFCDDRRLTPRERLELFVSVCQAVQHAHQKGIIHRDIKPSNVLVALYDDRPVPKVIDFGVAKAITQPLTGLTLHTGFGTVIGTPQYMSPEQATFNNLDVDTRSDLYSLGVLLYELLVGSPPFTKDELKRVGMLEMLRFVREKEPSRPSAKLSTAKGLPSLAANRSSEPKKLTGLLRNELDWIVMKALEKDRTRRYETANGFAADVLRYLGGEAVQAHPPSAAYRLKKFVRRNNGPVIAVSLVVLALLAGVIGTGIGLVRANRFAEKEQLAKIDAEEKRGKAESAEQKERDRAEGERQAKERESAQRMRAERAYARTADVLDTMVSEVTGDSLATQKAITPEQKKFLTEVLTYYQEFAGEKADDEKTQQRTARAAFRVGVIEYRLGRKEESATAFRRARDGFAALATGYPALATGFPAPKYRQNLAKSHHNLGLVLSGLGNQPEAEEHYRKALAIQEKLLSEFPAIPEYRQDLARSHHSLGILLRGLGKRPEAEEHSRKALAIRQKLTSEFSAVPEYRHELALSHNNLGNLLKDLGKRAEAEKHYRKALNIREKLVSDFPAVPEYRQDLARGHNNLGIELEEGLGKRAEAEEHYRKALDIQEKLAPDFPAVPEYRQDLARSHHSLGILLRGQGKRPEAEEHYRKGLAIREKLTSEFPAVPEYRQELARSHNGLGILLSGLGKRPEAEEQFRKALDAQEKLATGFPTVLEYHQDLARSHHNLGNVLKDLGKRAEAEEHYRKALDIREKVASDFPAVPAYRHELAKGHNSLGALLIVLGKRSEGEVHYRNALSIQEKLASEFPAVPEYRLELGGSYFNFALLVRDSDKPADSLGWYTKAIHTLAPIHEREPRDVTARRILRNSHWGRARVHDQLRQYAEAVQDWDRAIELSPKEEQPGLRASRAMSLMKLEAKPATPEPAPPPRERK
jgi:tetratricopeptide (TPR) repeat protein